MTELGDLLTAIRKKHRPVGQRVAELAALQHGVVAAWQLIELGLTPQGIQRRVAAGYLHRVHRGVYAVGHPSLTHRGRLMAAVLACGDGAVLSHRSAAAVWDFQTAATPVVDVTVPRSRAARRRGIRIHRPRLLAPEDVANEGGFPVTTPTRTLFDLAGTLSARRVESIWEMAERRGLLDIERLSALCTHGRKGSRRLRTLIAEATPPEPTRSELERRFRHLCGRHNIPLPSQNVFVHGYEVDAHWPTTPVIVELDGYEFHRTRKAFEADRARDAALTRAGYRVLRFSWRQLTREPELVAAAVRTALSRSR